MAMQFHDPAPSSRLPIPGDNPWVPKFHPDQHKHDDLRPRPRDEKPPYLSDAEWEHIRIKDGEMLPDETPWDGTCQGPCCVRSPEDGHLL